MINLTYILGGYIIGGSLSYLYAEHNIHKDISHFEQSLLYTLGFIFRPVILGIMELEKLKNKYLICKSIKQIKKQLYYGCQALSNRKMMFFIKHRLMYNIYKSNEFIL